MRSDIRALRRRLPYAYAEATLREYCNDFYDRWQSNVSRGLEPPQSREFITGCFRLGFALPTFPRVANFLDKCRQNNDPPHPEGLLNLLLPWTMNP